MRCGASSFSSSMILPQIEDSDEFYYADLIGLAAKLPDGSSYGTVKALHDYGAGDMIEFALKGSGDIVLLFTKDGVPKIDLEAGFVTVETAGDVRSGQPAPPGSGHRNRNRKRGAVMNWSATVLTLFPEMFPGLDHSLRVPLLRDGKWSLEARDIRDHAVDRHRSVDDMPYGGGAGMVMRADIVDAALEAANTAGRPEIYLSPPRPASRSSDGRRAGGGRRCCLALWPIRRFGRTCNRSARYAGSQPWRFRALGWRARGNVLDRCMRAVAAGCPRCCRVVS